MENGRNIFYWIENKDTNIMLRCEMCSIELNEKEIEKYESFYKIATGNSAKVDSNWKWKRIRTWNIHNFKGKKWGDMDEIEIEHTQDKILKVIDSIIENDIRGFEEGIKNLY